MSEKFDWYNLENKDIVVSPALGVAVYISAFDCLVVRQEGSNGEDDATITINPGDIERFSLAVQNTQDIP